jgi:ADP-dependent phosphofructokinase/glucokinase
MRFYDHLEALKNNEKQVIHLELASIGDLALMRDIIDQVIHSIKIMHFLITR